MDNHSNQTNILDQIKKLVLSQCNKKDHGFIIDLCIDSRCGQHQNLEPLCEFCDIEDIHSQGQQHKIIKIKKAILSLAHQAEKEIKQQQKAFNQYNNIIQQMEDSKQKIIVLQQQLSNLLTSLNNMKQQYENQCSEQFCAQKIFNILQEMTEKQKSYNEFQLLLQQLKQHIEIKDESIKIKEIPKEKLRIQENEIMQKLISINNYISQLSLPQLDQNNQPQISQQQNGQSHQQQKQQHHNHQQQTLVLNEFLTKENFSNQSSPHNISRHSSQKQIQIEKPQILDTSQNITNHKQNAQLTSISQSHYLGYVTTCQKIMIDPIKDYDLIYYQYNRTISICQKLEDIVNNKYIKQINLPICVAGTGSVIYNNQIFYTQRNSTVLEKYDLVTNIVTKKQLENAHCNNCHTQWGGHNDIQFICDKSGVFIVFVNDQNSHNLVIGKINPDTLEVVNQFDSKQLNRTQFGAIFKVQKYFYTLESYNLQPSKINYKIDFENGQVNKVDFNFDNKGGFDTCLTYYPSLQALLTINNYGLYKYKVHIE